MGDPLRQIKAEKNINLKFASVLSPKMKSVYWRHFGFPLNETGSIITKQNVVCTLCNKVLTNHGNTTNLRAHLQHRHKDIFMTLIAENDIKIPSRKPQLKVYTPRNKRSTLGPKIKLEYQDVNSSHDDQAVLYETMVPMTYEDDDVINTENFTKVDVGATHDGRSHDANDSFDCDTKRKVPGINYRVQLVDVNGELDSYQLQDALMQMIVIDLRNPETIGDEGFINLMRTLSGKLKLPPVQKIEDLLREQHSDKFTTLSDTFKMHSQQKPFSLGFELWTNIHQRNFVSVYFNYTTDSPDYSLINQLYNTVEYNKFTSIDSIFEEFNMQNCTVAIINYEHEDYLKQFLQSKNIPIILSYDCIVDQCLRKVFACPAISAIVDEVKDTVMHYAQEISAKDVEVPVVVEEFPWTIFEFLKFFTESVSWPEDIEILVNTAKAVVETLNVLTVTLDTLKGEEIPHSSMLAPITRKILNRKLKDTSLDEPNVTLIKQIISGELQKLVLGDDHLTISAMLDPRFNRLTYIESLNIYIEILSEKYNKICEAEGFQPKTRALPIAKETTSGSRKSNLELFFDLSEEPVEPKPMEAIGSVDLELKRFRKEVSCSLDESPFLWWHKMGHLYPALKTLATQYQCVPCVINMNFKKSVKNQIDIYRRRNMLTGNLIDAILFLHHAKVMN